MPSEGRWTDEQVKSLNEYQQAGVFHPFTCGGENCRALLVATPEGWRCPECDYTQDWAHGWMVDGSWRQALLLARRA